MFYNRRWITLNPQEIIFLIISIVSWIFLALIKKTTLVAIESLSLPNALFWSTLGMGLSLFIFNVISGLHLPLSKMIVKSYREFFFSFLPALSGLGAIELYFYYQEEEPLYFFLWVPVLTLALLIIFLSPRRKLIRTRLFLLGIAVAVAIFHAGKIDIPILSTLFLVLFILLTRLGIKKGVNPLQILFVAILIKGLTSAFYSLIIWQNGLVIEIEPFYYAIGGGCFLGFNLLFYMKSLEAVRLKEIFFLSGAPLFCRMRFPSELTAELTPFLLAGGLVALSTILLRVLLGPVGNSPTAKL